jgi:hypothetical protein
MKLLPLILSCALFSLPALASPSGDDHEHRPVDYACQTDDGTGVNVEVKGYAPLEGSVQVVSTDAVYTHPLKDAGHEQGEQGELGHLYFTFGTPDGDATVLIGASGETLDGALLSPYGDHALVCRRQ